MKRVVQAMMATVCLATPTFGQVLNEEIKLVPGDGMVGARFGQTAAMSDGVVVIGAANDNGNNSGSAYLYDFASGLLLHKLVADDTADEDHFGAAVSIDSGIVAVGTPTSDANGVDSGSAYLFDVITGSQLFRLLPNGVTAGDRFGTSIAIQNGLVAVGAARDDDNGGSGSVYIFDALTGVQLLKIFPSDGADGDKFGSSTGIDNGVVVVGAHLANPNGTNSGAAYIFDVTTGIQIFKLTPNDGNGGDAFGTAIAIDDGIVAVSSLFDDDNGTSSGSVYLFDASTGLQTAKILPNDGAADDRFGQEHISLDDGILGVGAARDDDNGSNSGSAYLFSTATGQQLFKLLPSDGVPADRFGLSIAIENGHVVVGSYLDSPHGAESGSAYLFDVSCPADLTGDFMLNFFDVSVFLTYYQLGDLTVDFTGDGDLNFFDVSAFLDAYLAGCP